MGHRLKTRRAAGFTLLEIMVVVGILAVVTTLSLAVAFKTKKKPPPLLAINDIEKVCLKARTDAIVNRRIRHVHFMLEGQERYVELLPIQSQPGQDPPPAGQSPQGNARPAKVASAIIPGTVIIDPIGSMMVSFHPDGTCDGIQLEIGWDGIDSWVMVLEQSTSLIFVSALR